MRWFVPLLLVLLAPVCAHAQDRKPVIGIEADVVVDPVTHERKARVDEAYSKAVIAAGGIPLVLSPLELDAAKALGKVDAIVLTGGADVPPELYGEKPLTADKTVDPARLKFGQELVRLSFERAIPILGICYGGQLLNVVRGGKLLQDIPTLVTDPGTHRETGTFAHHDVAVEAGSDLARDLGASIEVNSNHHQSVKVPGRGMRVAARAPDGVVEAVESTNPGHFALAVQWHPERMGEGRAGYGIFRRLVAAARESRARIAEGIPLDVREKARAEREAREAANLELVRSRTTVPESRERETTGVSRLLRERVAEGRDRVR